MSNLWWLYWLAGLMVTLAILSIGAAVQEWLEWRKDRRK